MAPFYTETIKACSLPVEYIRAALNQRLFLSFYLSYAALHPNPTSQVDTKTSPSDTPSPSDAKLLSTATSATMASTAASSPLASTATGTDYTGPIACHANSSAEAYDPPSSPPATPSGRRQQRLDASLRQDTVVPPTPSLDARFVA